MDRGLSARPVGKTKKSHWVTTTRRNCFRSVFCLSFVCHLHPFVIFFFFHHEPCHGSWMWRVFGPCFCRCLRRIFSILQFCWRRLPVVWKSCKRFLTLDFIGAGCCLSRKAWSYIKYIIYALLIFIGTCDVQLFWRQTEPWCDVLVMLQVLVPAH